MSTTYTSTPDPVFGYVYELSSGNVRWSVRSRPHDGAGDTVALLPTFAERATSGATLISRSSSTHSTVPLRARAFALPGDIDAIAPRNTLPRLRSTLPARPLIASVTSASVFESGKRTMYVRVEEAGAAETVATGAARTPALAAAAMRAMNGRCRMARGYRCADGASWRRGAIRARPRAARAGDGANGMTDIPQPRMRRTRAPCAGAWRSRCARSRVSRAWAVRGRRRR